MKKILLLISIITFSLATVPSFAFSDLSNDFQYKEAIDYFVDKGIVQGYEDGTVKPDATVNRAEFMKIILELAKDKYPDIGNEKNCFPDVREEWFAKYVCFGAGQNIVNGYEDGKFHPEREISLVEAAKIVVETLDAKMHDISKDDVGGEWYNYYLKMLSYKAAIPTSIDWINSKITRGEAMEMMWRIKEIVTDREIHYFAFPFDEPRISFGHEYMRDENSIYYHKIVQMVLLVGMSPMGPSDYVIDEIVPADMESFEVLRAEYAKDKNHVYRKENILLNSDPDTFEFLDYEFDSSVYAKDKNQVYLDGTILEDANPDTFETINWNYSKDNNLVYHHARKIENADVDSFEALNGIYSKDKNYVYFRTELIDNADPSTFQILGTEDNEFYGKDAENAYYRGEILSEVDTKTFDFIPDYDGNYYYQNDVLTKDENGIYAVDQCCDGFKTFEEIDVETFEYYGLYNKDKDNIYYFVDEFLDWGLYRYSLKVIDDADVETFIPLTIDWGMDADNLFSQGEAISNMEWGIKSYLIDKHNPGTCFGMPGVDIDWLINKELEENPELVEFIKEELSIFTDYEIYDHMEKMKNITLEPIDKGYSFTFEDGKCCEIYTHEGEMRFTGDQMGDEIIDSSVENVPC